MSTPGVPPSPVVPEGIGARPDRPTEGLTEPITLGALALAGVVAQMGCFMAGFDAATGSPPDPGTGRLLAVLGLAGVAVVLNVAVRLARSGWLSAAGAALFLTAGAVMGGWLATMLPAMIENNFIFVGSLIEYRIVFIGGGAASVPVFVALAVLLRAGRVPWWPSVLAAPVLLETGGHASLLVALLSQSEGLATASANVVWTNMIRSVAQHGAQVLALGLA